MSADTRKNLTTPVGRIVMGSLYKPNDKDAEGKPLTVKSGPNTGQPRINYFFALAIPKGAEQHWAQTAWGAPIWQTGHTAFPQAANSPAFAWKIEDGDNAVPNVKGRKPVDNEGWARHWILKFSSGHAPSVYKQENGQFVQVTEADFIKPGYHVQVSGTVDGNKSDLKPGIYLNHQKVLFSGYGKEIVFGMSAEEAFGGAIGTLPPGASAVPLATVLPLPGTPAAPPVGVPAPSFAPAAPGMPAPGTAYVAPAVVVPNPGFLQVAPPPPAALPAEPLAAPPPPASGPQMTAKAQGVSYQAYIKAGWSDANLIAQGLMTI